MSINWVMLPAEPCSISTTNLDHSTRGVGRLSIPFTPLSGESLVYTSPGRSSLSLATYSPPSSSTGSHVYPANRPPRPESQIHSDSQNPSTQPLQSSDIQQSTESQPRNRFSLQCNDGRLYLTNKRIVYLPSKGANVNMIYKPVESDVQNGVISTVGWFLGLNPKISSSDRNNVSNPEPVEHDFTRKPFSSFAAPMTHVYDSHVEAPWIGPNIWTSSIRSVKGGGLPPFHIDADGDNENESRLLTDGLFELRLTFYEGGAYDFQSGYERVKEKLAVVMEQARARASSNRDQHSSRDVDDTTRNQTQDTSGRSRNGRGIDDMILLSQADVIVEDLPAYEQGEYQLENQTRQLSSGNTNTVGTVGLAVPGNEGLNASISQGRSSRSPRTPIPDEAPPAYDEVQREVLQDAFLRRE